MPKRWGGYSEVCQKDGAVGYNEVCQKDGVVTVRYAKKIWRLVRYTKRRGWLQ